MLFQRKTRSNSLSLRHHLQPERPPNENADQTEERLNRLKHHRAQSQMFFLIGLAISILLVQSAFQLRIDRTPAIPQPDPESITLTQVEIQETHSEEPREKSSAAIQTVENRTLILDLTELITKKDLFDLERDPKDFDPEKAAALTWRGEEDEADPFNMQNLLVNKADVNPQFPGGEAAFDQFLRKNFRYPEAALTNDITGEVLLGFVVDTSGQLSQIRVIKGLPLGMDKELLRVMALSPNWTPGNIKGHPVAVRFTKTVRFEIR